MSSNSFAISSADLTSASASCVNCIFFFDAGKRCEELKVFPEQVYAVFIPIIFLWVVGNNIRAPLLVMYSRGECFTILASLRMALIISYMAEQLPSRVLTAAGRYAIRFLIRMVSPSLARLPVPLSCGVSARLYTRRRCAEGHKRTPVQKSRAAQAAPKRRLPVPVNMIWFSLPS